MALDISAITGYVNENKNELIGKMVGGNTTVANLNLQTGVKSPTALNIITTDAVFQDGSVAGWTPSGTTVQTQRIITPGDIKVQEAINPKDVNKTYLSQMVKAGSYEDAIPFEEWYVATKIDAINKNSEKALWLGNKESGNALLNKYDGFVKIIDAENDVVEGNTASITTLTKENVADAIDAMYAVLPTDVLEAEDLVLAVGYDVARLYLASLKDSNLTHYKPEDGKFEFMVAGTNVKLFATAGLNNTSRMFMSSAKNMTVSVDLENDEEAFKLFYSEDDFVIKFHSNFKQGVQVAFPDQIVEFTLSA
jgi:hypothetical protein